MARQTRFPTWLLTADIRSKPLHICLRLVFILFHDVLSTFFHWADRSGIKNFSIQKSGVIPFRPRKSLAGYLSRCWAYCRIPPFVCFLFCPVCLPASFFATVQVTSMVLFRQGRSRATTCVLHAWDALGSRRNETVRSVMTVAFPFSFLLKLLSERAIKTRFVTTHH